VTVLRYLACALVAVATVSVSRAADDANRPSRPIHIVFGFAAGGAPDGLARVIADRLTQSWNQSVIVENRAGA
jgi:tripartite-type tricarboxylate transporter receptor subunit TctC